MSLNPISSQSLTVLFIYLFVEVLGSGVWARVSLFSAARSPPSRGSRRPPSRTHRTTEQQQLNVDVLDCPPCAGVALLAAVGRHAVVAAHYPAPLVCQATTPVPSPVPWPCPLSPLLSSLVSSSPPPHALAGTPPSEIKRKHNSPSHRQVRLTGKKERNRTEEFLSRSLSVVSLTLSEIDPHVQQKEKRGGGDRPRGAPPGRRAAKRHRPYKDSLSHTQAGCRVAGCVARCSRPQRGDAIDRLIPWLILAIRERMRGPGRRLKGCGEKEPAPPVFERIACPPHVKIKHMYTCVCVKSEITETLT